ncbi:hypothetical protein EC841_10163 [Raoultella ornithinolytica]|jgi:hypothetical protein|uniref:Secreted protein n=1 Tax=Raoultella ornithinolytica TaxID=54291 RepID=A0ABD7QP52_RAOOR|nr:hypothetical protein EC841_10163 [Raoultella ornithinolytica]SUQ57662.1 Uncharacterised protein [Raoultella terrigena]
MHQAQFVVGVIGGILSAVDQVMTPAAGYCRLGIIRFAPGTTRSRQTVMRENTGFRVAVAVPGYPHGTFAATSRFAKVCHNHPHIRLRQRESGRGGFLSSTSCALTVQVIRSGFKLRSTLMPRCRYLATSSSAWAVVHSVCANHDFFIVLTPRSSVTGLRRSRLPSGC